MRLRSLLLRLALLLSILFSFVWAVGSQDGDIGAGIASTDHTTHVSAGTTPQAVGMGVVMLLIYLLILNTPTEQKELRSATIWRRAAAFAIDLWVAVYSLSAIFACFPVLLEAHRTGTFRWSFQRDYGVASDWVYWGILLPYMVALVAYFLVPLMLRGQTVGAWIFKLVTVNSDGYPVKLPFRIAVRRLRAEFRGLRSPLKTFRKRDEQGRTFYDINAGSARMDSGLLSWWANYRQLGHYARNGS
jgi:uncharacterized RDD family membrane protein YckC